MSTVAYLADPEHKIPPVIYHPTLLAGDRPGQLAANRIIGEPQRLADRVQRDLRDIGRRWLRDLIRRVKDGLSRGNVGDVVGAWIAGTVMPDEDYPARMRKWTLFGDMGGRLLVAGIELGENRLIKLAEGDPVPQLQAFFDQDFDEALAFFRAKQLMSEGNFDALQDRYKEHGFVARRLAGEQLQERARRVLSVELERGRSIDEITGALERSVGLGNVNLPADRASDAYLENVARTNIATSYGAGRWGQLNDPDVRALRPFLQYRTAGDSRVRAAHRELNGIVMRNGSEVARQYAPPLGYQCRCVLASLSERQVRARGLQVRDQLVINQRTGRPVVADRGFRQPPGPVTSARAVA